MSLNMQDIVGVTLWNMRHNVDILEETRELPMEQLRPKRLQWFGHLQRMHMRDHALATEATPKVQTERNEEEARAGEHLCCG